MVQKTDAGTSELGWWQRRCGVERHGSILEVQLAGAVRQPLGAQGGEKERNQL